MGKISFLELTSSSLLTLPTEFRNKNWSESFGEIQQKIRENKKIKSISVDFTQCIWIDPLPLLSLICALVEYKTDEKAVEIYLPPVDEIQKDQKKVLAFLKKEGFLEILNDNKLNNFLYQDKNGIKIQVNDEYFRQINDYENELFYPDSTILEAKIVDLNQSEIKIQGIEKYVDNELNLVRHRFRSKIKGIIEEEIFNRVGLFLKETLENVHEHAYETKDEKKLVGFYVRYRIGLANNTLDKKNLERLRWAIKQEGKNSPRLNKKFVDNTANYFEIFVIDVGKGLTNSFYGDDHKKKFRHAWAETIGLGRRRRTKNKKKKTRFGGLYTISRLCINNYLTARDYSEWIGDELPIKGENPDYAPNRSYLDIITNKQVTGLGIIGRLSWKSASDEGKEWTKLKEIEKKTSTENEYNPYLEALNETEDIYIKYHKQHYKELQKKPYFIRDHRLEIENVKLNREYFEQNEAINIVFYLPKERQIKNEIYKQVLRFNQLKTTETSIIISDIPVWEASLYQMALEDAKYDANFLKKYERIVLITRRLTLLVLKKTNYTYIKDKEGALSYLTFTSNKFEPDKSLKNYVEWIRTHDSMIFWKYLRDSNQYSEYYLKRKVIWNQGNSEIELAGYLNFAKTLTDGICNRIYELSLERALCLSNQYGCQFKSIDVLTEKLALQQNSKFYNSSNHKSQNILLGSVYVTGYSEKAAEIIEKEGDQSVKIHFFQNQSTSEIEIKHSVAKLLLWPEVGKNWFREDLEMQSNHTNNEYRRIGTTHVIAPHGWKYFPVPRYKLRNKKTKAFVEGESYESTEDNELEYVSVYKCSPKKTYEDWQGKRIQLLSIGHYRYESNHDLFRIDIPYTINESFLIGERLSHVLLGELLRSLGTDETGIVGEDNELIVSGVKEYIKKENYNKEDSECALVVYPYHYNTEHTITLIKKNIKKELHNRIIALFPLSKDRTGTTFLTSPITIENIKTKLKEYKKGNPNKTISVLLFDDATIEGKTRKEIKHLLFGLGVVNIRSLTILERRRLPFTTSNPNYNIAYWRMDIPKLGNSHFCPICNALNILDEAKINVASMNVHKRIEEIILLWSAKSPYEANANSIIAPTNLELETGILEKQFGIYYDGSQFKQCGGDENKIEIYNSLGLAIYLSELHCMTSKDDKIFKYIEDPTINDYAKIEVLSIYLLLFRSELSYLTQERAIKELYEVCDKNQESNHTTFALIALLAQGKNKLECLYDVSKGPNEADISVSNYDLKILFTCLSFDNNSKFNQSKTLKRLKKGYNNLRDLYKQFHSEIYNDYGYLHDTPMQLLIRKEYSIKAIRQAEDSCDKLLFLLKEIPNWHYRTNEKTHKTEYNKFIKELEKNISEFKGMSLSIMTGTEYKKLERISEKAKDIFALILPIHDSLFISTGLRVDNFPLKELIEKLIDEIKEDVGISNSLRKFEFDKDKMIEKWITLDRDVERKINFIVGNSRHAIESISDPYNMTEIKKKGWITLEYDIDNNYMNIVLINKSKLDSGKVEEEMKKRSKPEKLHLKELEIKIECEDVKINGKQLLKTKIKFPYL